MHKKYLELFRELTRATAVAAEQVMDYDKEISEYAVNIYQQNINKTYMVQLY